MHLPSSDRLCTATRLQLLYSDRVGILLGQDLLGQLFPVIFEELRRIPTTKIPGLCNLVSMTYQGTFSDKKDYGGVVLDMDQPIAFVAWLIWRKGNMSDEADILYLNMPDEPPPMQLGAEQRN